ncbi:hypothetical protein [Sorangium sp. So ce385]|uniref:hypothetical protein n=1 Tax=Sorangium sp. So ce385 TaxID=3133308 RepID=UPI003F5C16EC
MSTHVNPGFARSSPRPLARRQGNRIDVLLSLPNRATWPSLVQPGVSACPSVCLG